MCAPFKPGAGSRARFCTTISSRRWWSGEASRFSFIDQALARRLHEQGVSLSLVESALLLASLRRLVRPAGLPPLPRIRSLAYFQAVIAELQEQPLPEGYLEWQKIVAA
jgi:hypothetical protein